jgi:hypothetical protein
MTCSRVNRKDKVRQGNALDCDENLETSISRTGTAIGVAGRNLLKVFVAAMTWTQGHHTGKFAGQNSAGFGRRWVAGCVTFDCKNTGSPGDMNFAMAGGSPVAFLLLGQANKGTGCGSFDRLAVVLDGWIRSGRLAGDAEP